MNSWATNRDKPEGTGSEKNKTKTDYCLCFLCSVGNDVAHHRRGKEEEKKVLQIHPVSCFYLRRHVNPRTASDGGAWEDAPPLFHVVPEEFPSTVMDYLGTVL